MTDKQFEEFLRESAKDYNRPPHDTPRDEMWAEIDAARSAYTHEERPAGWWGFSRGIAAAVVMWIFPVAAVAGGAALAVKNWAGGDEHHQIMTHDTGHHGSHTGHGDEHGDTGSQLGCDEGDTDTRLAALNALLQMDTHQAMPILMGVMERRDGCSVELRRKAVFLISQHETSETVGVLADAIRTDPDEEVRHQAVFWMGQLEDNDAVAALEDVLQDADDIELQKKVVFALAQHSSGRGMEILQEIALDRRVNEEVREQAIFWIGQEGSSEDLSILMDLYESVNSNQLKERIIFAVSQSGSSRAVDWLAAVAHDDSEHMELREDAVFWIGQISGSESVDALESILLSEEGELQEKAIFALAQHGGSRAMTLLRDFAGDREQSSEAREDAIFWLGQEGSQREVEFLMDLFETLENDELKEKVVFSVSQSDASGWEEWLMAIARGSSESVEVRKDALFWIGQEGDLDMAELNELYNDAVHVEMKEQVIFVISQRDESEAVDALIAIVRGEENTELRDKAIFWLGQTDDPRAAEFLAELIIRPNR